MASGHLNPFPGGDQPCVHLPFVHLSVQWDPGLEGQVARVCERSWAASLLHLSASICLPRASAHRGPQSSRGVCFHAAARPALEYLTLTPREEEHFSHPLSQESGTDDRVGVFVHVWGVGYACL